jgi:gliding motility-associated-like protein
VFPVGSGSDLRTLQISAPSSSSSEYAVAWLAGNPDATPDPTNSNQFHSTSAVTGTIKAVSPVGQWDWFPVNGNGEGLVVTISIPALSGDFFTSASDVRLVGWNGTSWVNLGTSGASGLTENSTLSGTMIAGIQALGIGSIKSIVAVVASPVFTVVQNADGTLTVIGTAEKDGTVTITFPDKSTIVVTVNSQGGFGPVTSLLPQVLKDVVKATVTNLSGLTSAETIVSYETKQTVLPSEAFTPNGDGINDTWNIVDIEKFPNTSVRVFNRWGHLVFSAKNYLNDWAGNYSDFNSILPESSSYYYQIDYGTDGSVDKEGWLYIRK